MSLREFGAIVKRVMDALPREFQPYLGNLIVDVETEPSHETLHELDFSEEEIASGETVYGLFCPIVPESSELGGADEDNPPRRIIIFKNPLEEDFPDRRELEIEIRKTVIHELAHHFGWTDRDLEKFDDKPDPFT